MEFREERTQHRDRLQLREGALLTGAAIPGLVHQSGHSGVQEMSCFVPHMLPWAKNHA